MTLHRGRTAGPAVGSAATVAGASYEGMDDRGLIARVTEGDGGALEALYGRYGRACYGLARRILADEQLAQDAVQESSSPSGVTPRASTPAAVASPPGCCR
jgi:hypothetical protein